MFRYGEQDGEAVPRHVLSVTDTRHIVDVFAAPKWVVDLARPYVVGMPQSPNHPPYRHAYTRRHGDIVRADGGSAAADIVTLGTHVGTHIDAIGHVSQDGQLHGGIDASQALDGGLYRDHGIDRFEPFVGRGVLLDIPALHGVDACDGGYEITPGDLAGAAERQGVEIRSGDIVLIRSGWARHWGEPDHYVGLESGVPGCSEDGAKWLAAFGVSAVGADTIAFERLEPGAGHSRLPAHRVLLVESGINIIETLDLEELAATGASEFGLIVAPLPLVGATGSPVRPLAILGGGT